MKESRRKIYVEISTLFEATWSGIANVTANLSRALLRAGEDVTFFAFDKLIKSSYVINALHANDGGGLHLLIEYGDAVDGNLTGRPQQKHAEIGIFPNFKRGYQKFDTEILIVHDLSFILTPELHEPHLVADYMEKIYRDVHAVHKIVCVSNATREDLVNYYRVPEDKISVVHLGADDGAQLIDRTNDVAELQDLALTSDRYFLVLGTIEPRKNIELVIDFLASNREILDRYKFVFAGRNGWGKTFQEICAERGVHDPRVVHFGYIGEAQRRLLLRNTLALLFPSWFEGFGLPVIEAMAAGVPVIGAQSSSIVEVGGHALITFEPGSIDSFSKAIEYLVSLEPSQLQAIRAQCAAQAGRFSWKRFQQGVLSTTVATFSDARESQTQIS